jgi:hypothetical protein
MPSQPNIPPPAQQGNINNTSIFNNPIDPLQVGSDIGGNALNAFTPITLVTGAPTIIDANSLGILIQGAGFGQVKSFIISSAIKANDAVYKLRENEVLKGNAVIYKNQLQEGFKEYFQEVKSRPELTNKIINTSTSQNKQYVFDRVLFSNNAKVVYEVNSQGQVKEVEKKPIPDMVINACVVSVDANRYIQQSIPVNASIGTVKEIMAFGEYSISIEGHLINDLKPKEYPLESIQVLDTLCKTTTAINITSEFLSIFGINKILIMDYSISQIEGFSGIVSFSIKAISDTPFQILKSSVSSSGSIGQIQNPSNL